MLVVREGGREWRYLLDQYRRERALMMQVCGYMAWPRPPDWVYVMTRLRALKRSAIYRDTPDVVA